MQKLTPCLWFDTDGEDAAKFYISVFPNSRILDVSRYGKAGPRPDLRPGEPRLGNQVVQLVGIDAVEIGQVYAVRHHPSSGMLGVAT